MGRPKLHGSQAILFIQWNTYLFHARMDVSRVGFIGKNMGHMNSWSLRKIGYFMYTFSKIGIILTVATYASRKVNDSLG